MPTDRHPSSARRLPALPDPIDPPDFTRRSNNSTLISAPLNGLADGTRSRAAQQVLGTTCDTLQMVEAPSLRLSETSFLFHWINPTSSVADGRAPLLNN